MERIITPFGIAYSDRYPLHFEEKNAETLAYYIVVLQTVKHNKKVDGKMDLKKDQFCKYIIGEGYTDYPKD